MEFRLLHFYPDLMSLYGSYGNLAVLRRFLERLGHTAAVEPVPLGGPADLSQADLIFMGAGTERAQKAALADFSRFGPALREQAEAGAAMLFAGNAMELLGASITCRRPGETETVYQGLGLSSFTSIQEPKRLTGDVYGHTSLYPEAVVGFMNKCALIFGVETPLLDAVDMGWGNEAQGGPEGFHWNNVFASELTGPLLVKNPRLLEAVAGAMLRRRGASLPETLPRDDYAESAYAVTEEQLKLRLHGR